MTKSYERTDLVCTQCQDKAGVHIEVGTNESLSSWRKFWKAQYPENYVKADNGCIVCHTTDHTLLFTCMSRLRPNKEYKND